MAEAEQTPFQRLVADALARLPETRNHYDRQLQRILKTKGKPLYDIARKNYRPKRETLKALSQVLGQPVELLELALDGQAVVPVTPAAGSPEPEARLTDTADGGETVEIIRLDLSFPMGPGATIDDYVEDEPVIFDLGYIRSFTRTAPSRLRLARGVGDSMFPTLNPYDLVWIDSTQTHLNQTDRIWAVSINGGAAIKRLRPLKGGRVLVISDNPSVENYEVDHDEIHIGGRVIRFTRDL